MPLASKEDVWKILVQATRRFGLLFVEQHIKSLMIRKYLKIRWRFAFWGWTICQLLRSLGIGWRTHLCRVCCEPHWQHGVDTLKTSFAPRWCEVSTSLLSLARVLTPSPIEIHISNMTCMSSRWIIRPLSIGNVSALQRREYLFLQIFPLYRWTLKPRLWQEDCRKRDAFPARAFFSLGLE